MNLRTITWLLLLAALPAFGAPPTATESAELVRQAQAAQNVKALRALAEHNDPDPWLVLDRLCAVNASDPIAR